MILLTYGTRPEWIKIKPLINLMKKEDLKFKILFTGQHETIKDSFFDYKLDSNSLTQNRLDSIIVSCLMIDEKYLKDIKAILVQGDTSSVLGLSIMAMHRKLDIIHMEAGLRSYDKFNPYPEEYNRILTSNLSTLHLCPTEQNKDNLFTLA
jgi:UDP-N-acetylglucosamine 2-epimerase (non-hydrolysing)